MAWNVVHLARILKHAGGVPAYGNSTYDWDLSMPDLPPRGTGAQHGFHSLKQSGLTSV